MNYTTESVIDERAASHVQSAVTPPSGVPGRPWRCVSRRPWRCGPAHGAPGRPWRCGRRLTRAPRRAGRSRRRALADGRGVPDHREPTRSPPPGNGTTDQPSDLVTRAAAITRKGPTPDYREPSAAGQSDHIQDDSTTADDRVRPEGRADAAGAVPPPIIL